MSELRAWRSTLIPAGGKQRQEDLNSLEVRLGSTVSSRLPSYVGRLSLTNQRMQSETRVGLLLTENLQTISSNAPPSTERNSLFPNLTLSLEGSSHCSVPVFMKSVAQ